MYVEKSQKLPTFVHLSETFLLCVQSANGHVPTDKLI